MKIDQIKMGSLLSYLSLILGTVVSLVYTPIMIERLGQSEYGVYSIVLPMVSYLNLFSFGLGVRTQDSIQDTRKQTTNTIWQS